MTNQVPFSEILDFSTRNKDKSILSVYLDMSVNENNKRTYDTFLRKEESRLVGQGTPIEENSPNKAAEAFASLRNWIQENYNEENKGIAYFYCMETEEILAYQYPIKLDNLVQLDARPALVPLLKEFSNKSKTILALLDREHFRMYSIHLGEIVNTRTLDTDPYPAPHDVKAGGFSSKDFQKRKLEETKHFMKEFSEELEDFLRTEKPSEVFLLGTEENRERFKAILQPFVTDLITHESAAPLYENANELLERVSPMLHARQQAQVTESLAKLRSRVSENYQITTGANETLKGLQEGKVSEVLLDANLDRVGSKCNHCSFAFVGKPGKCQYCGSTELEVVDLKSEVAWQAVTHEAILRFVGPKTLDDHDGISGFLRF